MANSIYDWLSRYALLIKRSLEGMYGFYLVLYTCNKWPKMNNQAPKERLGTSRLNHVFLKIYRYDLTLKFQE